MNMEETNTRLARQAEIIARQESYIAQLREELEDAYAALRARENADAAETEERKTKSHDHRWIDVTTMKDLPYNRYLCSICDAGKMVNPDGFDIDGP